MYFFDHRVACSFVVVDSQDMVQLHSQAREHNVFLREQIPEKVARFTF